MATAVSPAPVSFPRDRYADAFREGFPITRRFLVSRGAPADQAEEIAQAAWVKGWEFRGQLKDPSLVQWWVNSIARNMFWSNFRRTTPELIAEDTGSYSMDLKPIEVRDALRHLTEPERELIEAHYLDGKTAEELAVTLGLATASIRVRLLRIRNAFRRRIAPAVIPGVNT